MNDFYELRNPQEEINGMDKGKWYTIAKGHPIGAALLNNGSFELGILGWTEEENTIFYFDTRQEAIDASIVYYDAHNQKYPAHLSPSCTEKNLTKDIQPEVMEF